eukprot:4902444-Amphidinium_carterae.1
MYIVGFHDYNGLGAVIQTCTLFFDVLIDQASSGEHPFIFNYVEEYHCLPINVADDPKASGNEKHRDAHHLPVILDCIKFKDLSAFRKQNQKSDTDLASKFENACKRAHYCCIQKRYLINCPQKRI